MSSAFPFQVSSGNGVRFRKIKGKFSLGEVHILLEEVKKNRHVVVGKFNSSVPTEVKKRKWAEITQSINAIGESDREVNEVIKKWAELECDTKHKMSALNSGAPYPPELTTAETIVSSILDLDQGPPGPPPGSRKRRRSEEEDEDDDDDVEALRARSGPGSVSETKTVTPPPTTTGSLSVKCDAAADAEAAPIESDDDDASPEEASDRDAVREQLAQSASLSVQEQHMTNALLGTVSRSLELLAESAQQLAETQQEFARESLRLQRETVHVLRDFASGALTLLHERVNGRPPLL